MYSLHNFTTWVAAPASKYHKPSFLLWIVDKSAQPGFLLPCHLLAHGDSVFLHLQDFLLGKCPAFLDFFVLHDCLPRNSLNTSPKQSQLWKSKVTILLTPLLTSPRRKNLIISQPLCTRRPPIITSPSLFTKKQVKWAPLPAGFLYSCVRKFSSIHTRTSWTVFSIRYCIFGRHPVSWICRDSLPT